jgi:hypothetical protein
VLLLLGLGLVLIVLALVPGLRRPPLLLTLGGLLSALVARTLTTDDFLIVAAGVLPVLSGFVAREIVGTFDLLVTPRREARRVQRLERRPQERLRQAEERERRRRRLAA